MQELLEGISFNFAFVFIHHCIFFMMMERSQYPASINEIPSPDVMLLCVYYDKLQIFYNHFMLIRTQLVSLNRRVQKWNKCCTKEIKKRAGFIVELYKHAGIFKNTRRVWRSMSQRQALLTLLECS